VKSTLWLADSKEFAEKETHLSSRPHVLTSSRIRLSAATIAVTVTTSVFGLGCGSGANTPQGQAGSLQSRSQDPDPKFFTGDNPIPGRYVVALALNDAAPAAASNATEDEPVEGEDTPEPVSIVEPYQEDYTDTNQRATALCSTYGGTVAETYSQTAIVVTETMTEAQARAMSNDPEVLSVAEDFAMYSDNIPQAVTLPSEWGLDQIDQRPDIRNSEYRYINTGAGVHAYVMDSGININHSEFQGRASLDYSAVNGESPSDQRGHGTACGQCHRWKGHSRC
jgi:subtilisin family serine protease